MTVYTVKGQVIFDEILVGQEALENIGDGFTEDEMLDRIFEAEWSEVY